MHAKSPSFFTDYHLIDFKIKKPTQFILKQSLKMIEHILLNNL
jgi:hypothetical protein